MRHAGRCGDSAVAVRPTTSRKVITRLISSGSRTSIGDGGMVASRSLPISQTARIGTSTRPTPSMAAVTVRSRWPGSAASPRPKRRRRKRPPAHSSTVRMAQPPRPARSRPSNCRPRAQPRAGCRRQRLQRGAELRPELAPDVARQGRGVAAQQRAQHDLAAQLGQAFDELVGAGDHHFALLDAAFADRGLLGQPVAVGLHRVRFGHGVAGRLGFERRQKLARVGEVAAGKVGRRRGGRAHVARLLAQARRSRPAAGSPARRGWRCGRVGVSTARRAGRTAAAAAQPSGPTPGRLRPAAGEATPGGWESARRPRCSAPVYHGVGGPSCRPLGAKFRRISAAFPRRLTALPRRGTLRAESEIRRRRGHGRGQEFSR